MTPDDVLGRSYQIASGVGSGFRFTVVSLTERYAVVHDQAGGRQHLDRGDLFRGIDVGVLREVPIAPIVRTHPVDRTRPSRWARFCTAMGVSR